MRKLLITAACLCVFTSVAHLPAIGAPSGLNIIPTADVLDRGVISLETESSGTGRPWGGDCDQFGLFQVGIGYGIEFGLDRCLTDPNTWLNVK